MRRKAEGPKVVLDASALLAYLQRERGYEVVRPQVRHTAMSTVNLEEVLVKSQRYGRDPDEVASLIQALGVRILEHSREDALASTLIDRQVGRKGNLSLGDRACISLGARLGVPVLTAERAWEELGLAVNIRAIR